MFFGQLRTLGRRGAQIGSRQGAGFGKAGEILPPRLDEVGHEHRQHKAGHLPPAQRVAADGGEYLFIAHAERLFRHRRARGGVQKLGVGQFPFVGKAGGEAALLLFRQALGRVQDSISGMMILLLVWIMIRVPFIGHIKVQLLFFSTV